ncbi:hypothetical protein V5799_004287, partial [Amblyomma americanum]
MQQKRHVQNKQKKAHVPDKDTQKRGQNEEKVLEKIRLARHPATKCGASCRGFVRVASWLLSSSPFPGDAPKPLRSLTTEERGWNFLRARHPATKCGASCRGFVRVASWLLSSSPFPGDAPKPLRSLTTEERGWNFLRARHPETKCGASRRG